jgi:hypothetical protein
MSTSSTPQVMLPDMCKTHQALLVRQCAYGPADPWRALLIATQIALFQGATADPKVHAEMGGQIENLSVLGCLACRKPDLFGALIDKVQKTFPREAHISVIKALGERWVGDAASYSADERA